MRRFLFVPVLVLVLCLLVPTLIVAAAPLYQGAPPVDLPSLLTQFLSLAGVAALLALVVNILKYAGLVKDGDAPTWSAGLNLLGLIALFVLKVFVPSADIGNLDGLAAVVAQIGVLVLGLITQLLASKATHFAARGVWAIGTSYSLRASRKNQAVKITR